MNFHPFHCQSVDRFLYASLLQFMGFSHCEIVRCRYVTVSWFNISIQIALDIFRVWNKNESTQCHQIANQITLNIFVDLSSWFVQWFRIVDASHFYEKNLIAFVQSIDWSNAFWNHKQEQKLNFKIIANTQRNLWTNIQCIFPSMYERQTQMLYKSSDVMVYTIYASLTFELNWSKPIHFNPLRIVPIFYT